jgi:hypothetical protein
MSPYRKEEKHVHKYVLQRYEPPPFCAPVLHCTCGHYPPSPLWIRALVLLIQADFALAKLLGLPIPCYTTRHAEPPSNQPPSNQPPFRRT